MHLELRTIDLKVNQYSINEHIVHYLRKAFNTVKYKFHYHYTDVAKLRSEMQNLLYLDRQLVNHKGIW